MINRDPHEAFAGSMSPTIFRAKGFRFFFYSREEPRVHVHVLGERGRAKIWLEPRVEIASSDGLNKRDLQVSLDLVRERKDEIHRIWQEHFRR